MKLKLDENLGSRTADLIGEFGQTVSQERLNGASDVRLFETCISEGRCLITLDLDFADVIRFPARNTSGVVVLRPSRAPSMALLNALVRDLLTALQTESIEGRLWVVEPGRVRVHEDTPKIEE